MNTKKQDPFRYSAPDPTKPPVEYVNKSEFYEAMLERSLSVLKADSDGVERPRVSEYIGECITKICKGLGNRYNFRNYTFVEEMISDAILICLKRVDSFNPTSSANPYAYFTQVAFWEMVKRIKDEKRELEGKYKYIREMDINLASYQDHDEGHHNTLVQYLQTEIDTASQQVQHEKQYENIEEDAPVKKKSVKVDTLDFL